MGSEEEDEIIKVICKESENGVSPSCSKCSIYRVPEPLRSVNPKAYTPQLISIGPLHHANKDVKCFEQKCRYFQHFLDLTGLRQEEIVNQVQTWEEEARMCYPEAEHVNMKSLDFVKLLVLDGCFVLMHMIDSLISMRLFDQSFSWRSEDEIFKDMLLLENQLPFFILQNMYCFCSSSLQDISFLDLTREYFCNAYEDISYLETEFPRDPNHFVDLVRMHLTFPSDELENTTHSLLCFPSWTATKLHSCSVSFKKRNKKSQSSGKKGMMDIEIKHRGGIIRMSEIIINDTFQISVRNVIAYEQCHQKYLMNNKARRFTMFMHSLIQTNSDVTLLIDLGIIHNNFGSIEQITKLFNNLCEHVLIKREFNYLRSSEMEKYCKRRRLRWINETISTCHGPSYPFAPLSSSFHSLSCKRWWLSLPYTSKTV